MPKKKTIASIVIVETHLKKKKKNYSCNAFYNIWLKETKLLGTIGSAKKYTEITEEEIYQPPSSKYILFCIFAYTLILYFKTIIRHEFHLFRFIFFEYIIPCRIFILFLTLVVFACDRVHRDT